jgi:ABC-2 type transport system ATP-binding protein
LLDVDSVSKRYANRRGVEDIHFSMARGEIVGFLGPNGAGKTTTMRMITGYLMPSKGEVRVDGISMSEHSGKAKRKIGYLPETPPLYPDMTVYGYLQLIADLREIPVREQKRRIGETMERVGIQEKAAQLIRSLSKGYKQRVGLAQAILHEPDLLVLDEPTSGLDPNQIREIRGLIRELGEKHTVLLSTHILPEVEMICNRVLIIHQGRLIEDDTPENLSRRMNEGFTLAVKIKGPRDQAEARIRAIDQVERVEAAGEVDGTVEFRVRAKEDADIREALFFAMAEARFPILEMRRQNLSLEEVFRKLTTTERRDA